MNLTNNIISLKNISKTYYKAQGELLSIKNISFDVHKNDFIAIIGPSGCGKSTLLNIICEIDKDYEGTIIAKENLVIGYMLQNDSLFEWLTVLQNACLGLKINKNLTTSNKEYVEKLLIKYGLKDFINKKVSELSGGMKQRV
ncbi:MAG: ATP-binding cassette domain-containing protein, partial [Bacilli bacterium]